MVSPFKGPSHEINLLENGVNGLGLPRTYDSGLIKILKIILEAFGVL